MNKAFGCLTIATLALTSACDSSDSTTDLHLDGPPMIEQVRMTELYTDTSGATDIARRVFAFGTHPDATEDQVHPVTRAAPTGQNIRIIMDHLLLGNYLEEIACRGQVDTDTWGAVPINSTPDDIAKCSVQQDVLPATCKGPNAVCLCQNDAGCAVGTTMIAKGAPVGVLDVNEDGAADDTRFIAGSVGIQCGSFPVAIDQQASFWEPAGDQQVPARGGFEVLGPAIVLVPGAPLPTNIACNLTFADTVVDKKGVEVCAPVGGDISQSCSPGDVSAFSFKVAELELTPQGLEDMATDVSTTDSIFINASAPLKGSSINTTTVQIRLDDGSNPPTGALQTIVPTGTNPDANGNPLKIQIKPTGLLPNTKYVLVIDGVTDTYGQPPPAKLIIHFTTGT